MRIYIYFHPQGKVWAINQAADRVVFGGEAKGLQEREVSKKNLWDICADKTRNGYIKFGEINIADGAFHDAVWIVRSLYYRGIQQVLEWMPENVYRPVFYGLVKMGRTSTNNNAVIHAEGWLAENVSTSIASLVPVPEVRLSCGRGCYF